MYYKNLRNSSCFFNYKFCNMTYDVWPCKLCFCILYYICLCNRLVLIQNLDCLDMKALSCSKMSVRLHSTTSKKTAIFILGAIRTWNLAFLEVCLVIVFNELFYCAWNEIWIQPEGCIAQQLRRSPFGSLKTSKNHCEDMWLFMCDLHIMVSMGYVVLGKVYSVTTWLEELALLLTVLIQDCCHDVAATT
jgi:hypothetical protein